MRSSPRRKQGLSEPRKLSEIGPRVDFVGATAWTPAHEVVLIQSNSFYSVRYEWRQAGWLRIRRGTASAGSRRIVHATRAADDCMRGFSIRNTHAHPILILVASARLQDDQHASTIETWNWLVDRVEVSAKERLDLERESKNVASTRAAHSDGAAGSSELNWNDARHRRRAA